MARFFGHNAPFLSGNSGNLSVLPRQEDDRLIRNDLVQLLLTAPGERIMRPDYGAPIRTFVFEQMDDRGKSELERGIRNAIAKHERRVRVSNIEIQFQDNNTANIKIFGSFTLDRFGLTQDIGPLAASELLVELNLSTSNNNELR